MKNVTLMTVNWNQRKVLSLMLKSYVYHHYKGEPLNLLLVDNGSTDDSKAWLTENGIPFGDFPMNIWHEPVINVLYPRVPTQHVLLVDTDIEFLDNVSCYLGHMNEICKSVGERMYIGHERMKERISPWFWLFDHQAMWQAGMRTFKDGAYPWIYDVGAVHWEKMQQFGFGNYPLYATGDHDTGLGMLYEKFRHFGKLSWDLKHHTARVHEVKTRHAYVERRLREKYQDVDLRDKFVPHTYPIYTDDDMMIFNPDAVKYNIERGYQFRGGAI